MSDLLSEVIRKRNKRSCLICGNIFQPKEDNQNECTECTTNLNEMEESYESVEDEIMMRRFYNFLY